MRHFLSCQEVVNDLDCVYPAQMSRTPEMCVAPCKGYALQAVGRSQTRPQPLCMDTCHFACWYAETWLQSAQSHALLHLETESWCWGLVPCQRHSVLHQAAVDCASRGQAGTSNPAAVCRSSRCSWNGSALGGSPALSQRCGCAPSCALWPQIPSPAWPATPCRQALIDHHVEHPATLVSLALDVWVASPGCCDAPQACLCTVAMKLCKIA